MENWYFMLTIIYLIVCSFATSSQLNVHTKSRHLPPELYICEVCAKHFKTRSQFEKHRLEHSESYQEIRQQCKICSKWLVALRKLIWWYIIVWLSCIYRTSELLKFCQRVIFFIRWLLVFCMKTFALKLTKRFYATYV